MTASLISSNAKIAGACLILSVLGIGIGMVIIAVNGTLHGLTAAYRGVVGIGQAASALSIMSKVGVPMALFQIVGFGILSVMMTEEGEALLSTLSFGLLLFTLVVSMIEGTFQGRVTVWAGNYWGANGSIPTLYEPIRSWINGSLQQLYVFAYLLSMAGFGWGILRSGLLAPWIGGVSLGYAGIGR